MTLFWSKHGEVACEQHAPPPQSSVWHDDGWQMVPQSSASYPDLLYCEQCRLVRAFEDRRRVAADVPRTPASLVEQIGRLQHGDHACLFYDNEQDQLPVVCEFIKQGLARMERCLYICDEHSIEEVAAALTAYGIDVAHERERGALQLVPIANAHLIGGCFAAENVQTLVREGVAQALADGFTGLRATGEMTWLQRGVPGADHFFDCESTMNTIYPGSRAIGLCQYRSGMRADALDGALRTHPHVIVDDRLAANVFYEPPEVFAAGDEERVRWKIVMASRHAQTARVSSSGA